MNDSDEIIKLRNSVTEAQHRLADAQRALTRALIRAEIKAERVAATESLRLAIQNGVGKR